ncbi:MAG: creatininase family protein [Thermoplasmata archaeon]|nr:creatininase family protein [Thermoplasmata archaeon]
MAESTIFYDELTMTEFQNTINDNTVVILPTGAVEGHGSHLPLSTDSLQPEFIAEQVATQLTEKHAQKVLVAPSIRYAFSNTIRNLPGTVSLSFETMERLIFDILSELIRNGVKNIVVLSGHAGRLHMAAQKHAAQKIIDTHPDIKLLVLSDYDIVYAQKDLGFPEGDGHAGAMETSRVMAIRPELVKGTGERSVTSPPNYRVLAHPEEHFPTGIIGDPTQATTAKGEMLNELVIRELMKLILEMIE